MDFNCSYKNVSMYILYSCKEEESQLGELLDSVLISISDFLYSYILIVLLVVAGLYFTFKTKFVQIRLFPEAIRAVTERSAGKKVSSFQALMISTASRVGTGNIAGIAVAIVLGGPGSIFWMWAMAIIGAASAFTESTLAQIYKIKDAKGFRGGPAYYIEKALGKRIIGIIFAIFLIACMVYGLNVVQSYNISSSLEWYIPNYKQTIWPYVVGIVITILTALVIFGGVHRIGFVSSYIVPFMALLYMMLGLYTVVVNFSKVPEMFSSIFKSAFDFKAMFGGFAGSAMLIGTKRGLFSNEAGMGSAPNAAATADISHPVKQGLVQVVSVCIDTMLICTTSAFVVLLSGVDIKGGLNGIPLVQAAVQSQIGPMGMHFLTFSIFMFAFTSIIGNYCYAESNMLFIKNSKIVLNIFRCTCLVAVFLGTQATLTTVWNLADILMALMAMVNIIAIFLLGKVAIKALDDYIQQKKEGKDPRFDPEKLGIKNTESWN